MNTRQLQLIPVEKGADCRFARFRLQAATVRDAEQGLIDADLGGGVIKQRVARAGQGKSGGYRTMIFFKAGTRAFFVHGFAKNEKDNIEHEDLIAFRKLAARMLGCNDTELTQAINKNILTEVICHDETLP